MYIFFYFFYLCVCVCALFLSATAYFHVFSFFFPRKESGASDHVTFLPSREIFIVILVLDLFFIRYCILPSSFLVWHLPFFRFSYLLLLHGLVDVRHGSESRPFFPRKRLNTGKSSPPSPPPPPPPPHHASRPGWRGPPLDTCDARGLGQGRKAIGRGGDFTSRRGGNAARVAPPSVGIGYYPRPILLPGFGAWASMPAVLRATKSREGRRTRDWFHVPCDGSGV